MDTILTIYFDVSYVILLQCITLVVSCDDHTLIEISKKIFKIYSWVSLGYFAVNLSGGQPKNVLMIMLYWIGKISRNCTYLLPTSRSAHTVKHYFPPMTVHRFGVDPNEIMTSRETQE